MTKRFKPALSEQENAEISNILRVLTSQKEAKRMKEFVQHGTVSTYDHCMSVSKVSYWINHRFHLKADKKTLLYGAFLHDFYLYDWHVKKKGGWRHSYRHPGVASKNAGKLFQVSDEVKSVIECHMFPYTFWKVPKSREAWIVTLADKCVTVNETLRKRK